MKKYITLCFIILCVAAGCSSKTTKDEATTPQTNEEKLKAGYESCKVQLKEAGHPSKMIGESSKHDPSIEAAEYEGGLFAIEADTLYLCRDLERECSKEGGMNSGNDAWCKTKSEATKINISENTTFWYFHYGDGKGTGTIEKSSKSVFDQSSTLQEGNRDAARISVYVKKTGDKLIAEEIFMSVK